MLLAMSLASIPARAADCQDYYLQCRDALSSADKIMDEQEATIEKQTDHIKEITQQLTDLSALAKTEQQQIEDSRGDTIKWGLGGVVVGVLLGPIINGIFKK